MLSWFLWLFSFSFLWLSLISLCKLPINIIGNYWVMLLFIETVIIVSLIEWDINIDFIQ